MSDQPYTPENKNGHCWHKPQDGYSVDGKTSPSNNLWVCCHCGKRGRRESIIPNGHGKHYIFTGDEQRVFNGNLEACTGDRKDK